MKHDREFWTRHVVGWRASGLTQQMYCFLPEEQGDCSHPLLDRPQGERVGSSESPRHR